MVFIADDKQLIKSLRQLKGQAPTVQKVSSRISQEKLDTQRT